MKLNKMKIARLTNAQAKSINGGYVAAESTQHKFTCGWCSGGGGSFECATVNPNDIACNTTAP